LHTRKEQLAIIEKEGHHRAAHMDIILMRTRGHSPVTGQRGASKKRDLEKAMASGVEVFEVGATGLEPRSDSLEKLQAALAALQKAVQRDAVLRRAVARAKLPAWVRALVTAAPDASGVAQDGAGRDAGVKGE